MVLLAETTTDERAAPARVLVVDPSRESRDLLCTLLARDGTVPLAAASLPEAAQIAREQAIDLVVVDADGDLAATSDGGKLTPIVVLGKISRSAGVPHATRLAKPYHYRDLLHKIGEVLAARRAG